MTSKQYLSALPVRSTAASGSQVYESERAVNEYLLAHYGDAADQMPYDFGPKDGANFSGYLAQLCIDKRKGMQNGRALDVGCAVGGLTFRLVPGFQEVVGIDYSQHFVDAANQMKSVGQMNFTILKQGNIFEPRLTSFPRDIDRTKASFYHGDACNLDKSLGSFSVFILAINTLNTFLRITNSKTLSTASFDRKVRFDNWNEFNVQIAVAPQISDVRNSIPKPWRYVDTCFPILVVRGIHS